MPRLTDTELEVMRILWQGGAMKPAEILAEFPRRVSNSTLRTFLTTLLDKGHVVRVARGKAFYYRAKTRPESAFRTRLGQLLDVFCEGSYGVLLKRLVATQKLTPAEVAELRRLVETVDE